jgi:hypothetical protein
MVRAALVSLLLIGCSVPVGPTPETSAAAVATGDAGAVGSSPVEPTSIDECVATPGMVLQDVDPKDTPEVPWARPPGQKVKVYFQNTNAAERYMKMVIMGVATWNKSPCIDGEVVVACPANSNCVTVRSQKAAPDNDTDGEFDPPNDETQTHVRKSGTLTVFTDEIDPESDADALATIVHEMGRAYGLSNRQNDGDIMNDDADGDTNPEPDAVDFHNLLVIYGTK